MSAPIATSRDEDDAGDEPARQELFDRPEQRHVATVVPYQVERALLALVERPGRDRARGVGAELGVARMIAVDRNERARVPRPHGGVARVETAGDASGDDRAVELDERGV